MNIYINTVIFKRLIICFSLLCMAMIGYPQVVPDQMEYCGMKLSFTPGAKQKLTEYVDKIYENPRYYNQMVMKAQTYMPMIEEAFQQSNIPEDLKYIAIQESGLRADATSISKTIGFWQLSSNTASEIGLSVNDQIDERMHPFKSSLAVAGYFADLSKSFDNWVYTTIAYHEGINETSGFTDPRYYGQSFMMVGEDLHWYALKVIAYKIAYEAALNMQNTPAIWLEPILAKGGTSLKKIYKDQAVSVEEFRAYNLWLRTGDRLPKDRYYTVYIPRKKDTYRGYVQDPVFELEKLTSVELSIPPKTVQNSDLEAKGRQAVKTDGSSTLPPSPIVSMPEYSHQEQENISPSQDTRQLPITTPVIAKSISELADNQYALFEIKYDIDYSIAYIEYDANYSLLETANMYSVGFNQLLTNNQLGPNEKPKDGRILYLSAPLKALYHIVERDESLVAIAFKHNKSVASLQEKNRMKSDNFNIYIGQKLYLKKKKPKDEKMIVLKGRKMNKNIIVSDKVEQESQAQLKTPINHTVFQSADSTSQKNEISYPIKNPVSDNNQSFSKWIEHEVLDGETLTSIAEKYNTKVEIIKQINKLSSNHLIPGSILRILITD